MRLSGKLVSALAAETCCKVVYGSTWAVGQIVYPLISVPTQPHVCKATRNKFPISRGGLPGRWEYPHLPGGGGGCPGDGNNPISRQGVAREMAISPSPGVGVRVHSTQDHWPACRRSDIPWMLFAATCQISFVLTCENCLIRCGKFMPPCRKCMIRHTRSRQLVTNIDRLREIYASLRESYDSTNSQQVPCGKFMNLDDHSRPLVKTYGSVAGNLCLVAGNLWFDTHTTDALRENYEPRTSFAATCKNLWICCGKFMPRCGKVMTRHTHTTTFLQAVSKPKPNTQYSLRCIQQNDNRLPPLAQMQDTPTSHQTTSTYSVHRAKIRNMCCESWPISIASPWPASTKRLRKANSSHNCI